LLAFPRLAGPVLAKRVARQAQGAVVYPLQPIVADANGNSTSTTVINNPKNFSASRLYVNIHEAATMNGLTTQTGFNPIACGNITYH
jgi:hypothetical protein